MENTKKDKILEEKKRSNFVAIIIITNIALILLSLSLPLIGVFKSKITGWVIFIVILFISGLGWTIFYVRKAKPEIKEEEKKVVEEVLGTKQCDLLSNYYIGYYKGIRISDVINEGIKNIGQEDKEKTKIYYKKAKDMDTDNYIHFGLRPDNLEPSILSTSEELSDSDIENWLNNLASNPRHENKRVIQTYNEATGVRTVTEEPMTPTIKLPEFKKEDEKGEDIE